MKTYSVSLIVNGVDCNYPMPAANLLTAARKAILKFRKENKGLTITDLKISINRNDNKEMQNM